MGDPLLQVEELGLDFATPKGTARVLDGVSFALRRGEVFSLVGETGCGKTVTALAILGLLPPTARTRGHIWFEGEDLLAKGEAELRALRGSRITMIFQDPAKSLNPVFPVGEQIARVLMVHRGLAREAARARVLELLAAVALPDPPRVARSYPHELSGGMQQRAMIAMALACRPALLIADEPTTALDVTTQAQILDLILGLRDTLGLAVLLITHNLGVVAEVADRTGVMYAGHLVEEGPTEEVLRHPAHPYTQGLLKALPRVALRGQPLENIPGMVPGLLEPPPGCRFHPRCPYAVDRCRAEKPRSVAMGPDHRALCVLYYREGPHG